MKKNLLFGSFVCIAGFFFGAATGACTKAISHHVPLFLILFSQYAIGLVLNLPQVFGRGISQLKTKKPALQLLRDATGFTSYLLLFAALRTTSLVDAMLLSYTEPLWIPLIAWVWPGVKMRGSIWWGIAIGFLGVLLILQPNGKGLDWGALLAALSGFSAGIMFIAIHLLSATEPTWRTVFYNSLFGALASAPFAFLHLPVLSPFDWLCLFGVGIFNFSYQFLITYSFKHGDATTLGSLAYTVVFFSGLFGWIFWREIPNFVSFIGMALVILGSILSVYFEKKYQKRLSKSQE